MIYIITILTVLKGFFGGVLIACGIIIAFYVLKFVIGIIREIFIDYNYKKEKDRLTHLSNQMLDISGFG